MGYRGLQDVEWLLQGVLKPPQMLRNEASHPSCNEALSGECFSSLSISRDIPAFQQHRSK